jgi:hypothetical protein
MRAVLLGRTDRDHHRGVCGGGSRDLGPSHPLVLDGASTKHWTHPILTHSYLHVSFSQIDNASDCDFRICVN